MLFRQNRPWNAAYVSHLLQCCPSARTWTVCLPQALYRTWLISGQAQYAGGQQRHWSEPCTDAPVTLDLILGGLKQPKVRHCVKGVDTQGMLSCLNAFFSSKVKFKYQRNIQYVQVLNKCTMFTIRWPQAWARKYQRVASKGTNLIQPWLI